MKILYITHCSREKDDTVRVAEVAVTPDKLYTSKSLQKFIEYCRTQELNWAIFSDQYGVVFPEEKINWYSKPPDTVSPEEFDLLLKNFTSRLAGFDAIHFYQRSGETHPLFMQIARIAREQGLPVQEFQEEIIIQ